MIYYRYPLVVTRSSMTRRQRLIAGAGFTITACSIITLVEYFIVYPVPFAPAVTGGMGTVAWLAGHLYFEGQNIEHVKSTFKRLVVVEHVSLSTPFAHELIGVLFTAVEASPMAQTAVALLLPVLKFALRILQSWLLRDEAEGLATSIAIFEVEFFNTHPMVLVSLMSIDVIENGFFLYRLNQLAQKNRKTDTIEWRELLGKIELVVLIEFVEVVTPILYRAGVSKITSLRSSGRETNGFLLYNHEPLGIVIPFTHMGNDYSLQFPAEKFHLARMNMVLICN